MNRRNFLAALGGLVISPFVSQARSVDSGVTKKEPIVSQLVDFQPVG